MAESHTPEIAVVVASRDRPLRLRWLLNALEEQTLAGERFEVIVAHDSLGDETGELLRTHPLASAGVLREIRLEPGSAGAAAGRNAGWRAATAPVVAFTDDDCRPPSDWVENALRAATRQPGAVVQGATQPDPEELHLERAAPHSHTRRVNPPEPWAQACNIVYPRALLEQLDGFRTDPGWGGEDTDLAARARRAGAAYVGAPEVLTYHAVEPRSLPAHLRAAWRWQDLPALVKRNPELREHMPMWIFWKRTHVWLGPAVAGAALARRRGRAEWTALAIPWLIHTLPQQYGTGPRGRLRALSDLPARAAIDAVEVAALARGSIRWRTLFL